MRFVVISGPQSSGKTTAFTFLKQKYHTKFDYHPEFNQVNVHGVTLGSIAVSSSMEESILAADIAHLASIRTSSKTQVYETAMFHQVYIKNLAPKLDGTAYKKYKEVFSPHLLDIIFISTRPETSFSRRRPIYLARIEAEIKKNNLDAHRAASYRDEMLKKYEGRITDLFPVWHEVFDEIDYANSKTMIDNNNKSEKEFLSEFDNVFTSF